MTPLQNAQVGQEVLVCNPDGVLVSLQSIAGVSEVGFGLVTLSDGTLFYPDGEDFDSMGTYYITNDPSTIAKFKEGR